MPQISGATCITTNFVLSQLFPGVFLAMILTITAGLRALVRFATAPLRREVGPQGHGGSGAGGIHGMRTGTAMSLLWFTMV